MSYGCQNIFTIEQHVSPKFLLVHQLPYFLNCILLWIKVSAKCVNIFYSPLYYHAFQFLKQSH